MTTCRILWVNHRDPAHPLAGGAESLIWELMRRLPSPGFSHTLLCERVPGRPEEEVSENIRVLRRGGPLTLHYHALRWKEPHDACIECLAHGAPFFRGRFTGDRTIILLFHVHQDVVQSEAPLPAAFAVKILERTLAFRKSKFVAISGSTREAARTRLDISAPVDVIYPGVDCQMFVPGPKLHPPVILYLGMLKRYKRVDQIIDAFRGLDGAARLVIAGEGYDAPRLKALARDDPGIEFLGHVSVPEKLELLRSAAANVVASRIEGFGLTVLEAAASGTPTVAYNVGPMKEAIIERVTGALVPDGNVHALTCALREALAHPEWGSNARALAVKFSWESAVRKLEECIRDLRAG